MIRSRYPLLIVLAGSMSLLSCREKGEIPENPKKEGAPETDPPEKKTEIPPFIRDFKEESERLVEQARKRFGSIISLEAEAVVDDTLYTNHLDIQLEGILPNPLSQEVFLTGLGPFRDWEQGGIYLFFGFYSIPYERMTFLIADVSDASRLIFPLSEEGGEMLLLEEQGRFLRLSLTDEMPTALHCDPATNPPCEPPIDSLVWRLSPPTDGR
ncbi:MAG: hypothetical protein HYW02_03500 [Deltaproteobacteria bacterium]|nr:hypothetical protein [Deltaproteobacteria bacterium]MBI4197412.1 hypothetical protein [Deltaproteobacteria bacterium]